jgi:cardiolipin synthase
MLNLPNFLTLVRIVAIPFFLVLLSSELYLEAFAVFVAGGLTDALDGAIARMTRQQTSLGTYLDPVADKLLIISSFAMLGVIGGVPLWLAVLVVCRDMIILLGYGTIYFLVEERIEVRPSRIGKLSTVLQLITVGAVLVLLYKPNFLNPWLLDTLFFVTAAATGASGFQYVYRGLIWLQSRSSSLTRLS